MHRRELLATLGASSLLAGCLGEPPVSGRNRTPTGTTSDGQRGLAIARDGQPSTICSQPIQSDPGIYAIDDPVVSSDWQSHEIDRTYRHDDGIDGLVDEQVVVGLEADGRARAYPLSVLYDHEVVNDDFGGPVVVTYCPLCRSAMVADRQVDGETRTFGVSGQLWQPERVWAESARIENRSRGVVRGGAEGVEFSVSSNLVLYDQESLTYWSQILARGICGPGTGTRLSIRPSTLTTWGEWTSEHPETGVLVPPPASGLLRPDAAAGRAPRSGER